MDRSSRNVEEEVRKLFNKGHGKITNSDFAKLRTRFDDVEVVEKIQKLYLEKYAHISKKAKKFAQLIREKYSNSQYPYHTLLEKARLYKAKHHLSEEEFAEFQRIYEQELLGVKSPEVIVPINNMTKVLGSVNVEVHGSIKLNDADSKNLQEIMKTYAATRPIHAQVQMQSLQYRDCAPEALAGTFEPKFGHRVGDHIHPVIAAMFIPKIEKLEGHFIRSNLSAIVKARFNNEMFTTRPDYELYYSLVNDPNDVVCDSRSPMLDLLNRVNLQVQLWNCVLNLRNGQYYNQCGREFMNSIDLCKLNRYDSPDLMYGRSDGIVIKRLISSFSFRPSVVATTPFYNMSQLNPYAQQIRPVVTNISMYNLRLPPMSINAQMINLKDSLQQDQFFNENNQYVQKTTELIYSDGVLIFYVDRRATAINYMGTLQPYNISRLPVSVAGRETLNTSPIVYEQTMLFPQREMSYRLRSVVVTLYDSQNKIIYGSSALISKPHRSAAGEGIGSDFFTYDPINVTRVNEANNGGIKNGQVDFYPPVRPILEFNDGSNNENFDELAKSCGCIFIYEAIDRSTNRNEDPYFLI